MALIPKIFHQIWLGGAMPEEFQKYQRTWLINNPSWKLILWNNKNINELKNINFIDYAACKNFSEKSDYLRFCILLEHGGVYIDTDFECYKNIEMLLENAEFIIGEEFFGVYNGAFMAATPHNKNIQKIFLEFHKQLKKTTGLCRTGPIFISHYINPESKDVKIIPGGLIYPEYWLYVNSKIEKKNIYANHHYSASWQGGIRKKIFFIKQKISKIFLGKYLIIVLHYVILKIRAFCYGDSSYQ